MSTFALGLVLIAAVFHALWNLLYKRAGITNGFVFLWLVSAMASLFFAPFAITVIVQQKPVLGPAELVFIGGSALLHIAYHQLLIRGYQIGDLSLVYPLARGTGPMLSTAAAIIIFHERPSGIALSGAVLIGLGVYVISGGFRRRQLAVSYRPVAYALLTGVCIAMYTLWDKYAVGELLIIPIVFTWISSLYRTTYLSYFAFRERDQIKQILRSHLVEISGVAILSPLSYLLILMALVFSPVSYIAPARELSILIGVLIGSKLLSEGYLIRRGLAASAMILGLVFLALG
jgi:drug/metabolite transporter (DMT)-like permease